jgi:hypothetical protein
MTADPPTTPATAAREPRFAVSAAALLGGVLAAAAGSAAAAALVASAVGAEVGAALLGAGAAGVVALLGAAILRPARVRAVSDWLTLWLAATVARMLLTPLLAVLLYSALPLPAKAFFLAVAGSYLACLAVETAVLARSAGGALDAAAASRGAPETIEADPALHPVSTPPSGDRS